MAVGLALAGDTLVVGAVGESSGATNPDDNSAEGAGAVYVFQRSGTTWTEQAYVKASNLETNDNFGIAVGGGPGGIAVAGHLEDGGTSGFGGDQGNGANASGALYIFR